MSDEDLAEVVAHVERARGGPMLAVGVSLGGLILARYLARRGDKARLQAALVVSSPLDVEAGSACIERPPLNALLSWHMARSLRRTVRSHGALRGEGVACDWRGVAASRSVRQFDAAFTARHFGFESVDAYYRAATLRGKLHRVRTPLLCLCAADDPFQPEHGESGGAPRPRPALTRACCSAGGRGARGGGGRRARGAVGDGARRPHRLSGGLVARTRRAVAVPGAPHAPVLRGPAGAAAAAAPAARRAAASVLAPGPPSSGRSPADLRPLRRKAAQKCPQSINRSAGVWPFFQHFRKRCALAFIYITYIIL